MTTPALDIEGPAAPPRANGELVFDAAWQRRLFATTLALCEAGTLTYDDFRQQLIHELSVSSQPHWLSWQDALESLLAQRHVCTPAELTARADRFATHSHH